MRKLALPDFDSCKVFKLCCSGIGDKIERFKVITKCARIVGFYKNYQISADYEELFCLPQSKMSGFTYTFGGLNKEQLNKLYKNHMVPEKKPARSIYDKIKAAANGKCPYCCGIGVPSTLDHYLPKSPFPQYSVYPENLIPCCRDCNSVKGDTVPTSTGEQVLHFYLDKDFYFDEQWVHAEVIHGEPVTIHFFSNPPSQWAKERQERVNTHFRTFKLAERFGIAAASSISELVYERKTSLKKWSPEDFKAHLAEKSKNPDLKVNDWKRVMFKSLAEDDWFCHQSF